MRSALQPRREEADTPSMLALAAVIEARTGQRIAAGRAWRIDSALASIATEAGGRSIDQLVADICSGSQPALTERVVEALLNQETSFFRDAGAIEGAVAAIASTAGASPRIWCAGCATGQEPLSLAIAFAERGDELPDIVATDLSSAAIRRARLGRFTHFEIQRGLAIGRLLRWFEQESDGWTALADLGRRIAWQRRNIVLDPPPPGRFDAVFCRNLLFYLAPERRSQVLDTIAGSLKPGGLLMLGAGETVIGQSDRFVPSKRFRGLYELSATA